MNHRELLLLVNKAVNEGHGDREVPFKVIYHAGRGIYLDVPEVKQEIKGKIKTKKKRGKSCRAVKNTKAK